MTAKHHHYRRQATVAVASLAAGVLATALAIYTQADPYAFTSEPSLASGGGALQETTDLTAEPRPRFLLRLNGTAVAEAAEVDLPPMTIVAGRSHRRIATAEVASKTTCVPRWRNLETGPVDRHVLVSCPGARDVPPPPASTPSTPSTLGKLRLPTIASLNARLPDVRLPADLLPSGKQAAIASAKVDTALDRRWERASNHSTAGADDVAVLPLQNPFSWAPTKGNPS